MLFSGKDKVKLVLQTERNECGLACLAMVLDYHGYSTDLLSLRELYPISQHGENLQTLMAIAADRQLTAKAYQLQLDDLHQLKLPAMLHWDLQHFVVLKDISDDCFYINDPAKGAVRLKKQDIGVHFTGVALELAPQSGFRKESNLRKLTLREIWRRASDATLIKGLITSFALSIVLLLCALVLPFHSQLVIDNAVSSGNAGLAYVLTGGFLFLLVSRLFTELIRALLLMKIGTSVGFDFATTVYAHLLRLNYDFFARRHIGDITSRFRSLGNIVGFISSGVIGILVDGVLICITLVLMFAYSLNLSIVALVPVVIYLILRLCSYEKIYQLNTELVNANATENTFFIENIRSIVGTKIFNRELERGLIWQNSYASSINIGIALQKTTITISFLNNLMMGAGGILLMLLGGLAVINDVLSLGMVFAFFQFKDQFTSRVFSLLDKYFEIKLLDVHLTRLSDIVFASEEKRIAMDDAASHLVEEPLVKADGLLEVKDLFYRYSRYSKPLFQNVSFAIGENESVAIIGPTGCGKSTLLKLILGLIEPEDGEITLGGRSVAELGLQEYRSRIAAVLQDDALASGTVFENISFFDANPDVEKVELAAKTACIHEEIIRLPLQYHTFVGNYGSALSGGQVQRIMIARAVYKSAKVLVLDEATSHLDMNTEKKINQALQDLKVARVIVAHRPSSILQADRIFELTSMGLKEVKKDHFRTTLRSQEPVSV